MKHKILLFLLCTSAITLKATDPTEYLERPMPGTWQYAPSQTQSLPSDDAWWHLLKDPVLDTLITMGEDANFDVIMAQKRMEAASRQIDQARAAYYPTIGVDAAYTRARTAGVNTNTYALQGTMQWQIDLFGQITANVRQKKAQYRASRAEWTGTMVSMAAQIATNYIQMRVWEAELQVAQEHIIAQDSIASLVKARYDAGLGNKPSFEQALALMYNTRASVPSLRTSVATARASLAMLLGRYPQEIDSLLSSTTGLPDYKILIGTGVPAELLRRRPDIVQAEAQLASAAAEVGIAKKDFLPTLTLQGNVGVSAPRVGDMFTDRGFGYSVTPTLSWTIFDGLARRAQVAAAKEQMQAQIASYNQTVLNAYNEVDNALLSYHNSLRSIANYEAAKAASAEFLSLELDLYVHGLAPYSDVATAQTNLLNYTNSLITARGNALTALINLYQALGGGFKQL